MIANFKATNPDDMAFTLTVTMSLKEWKKLSEQIPGGQSPGWELRRDIARMVEHATTHFAPKSED